MYSRPNFSSLVSIFFILVFSSVGAGIAIELPENKPPYPTCLGSLMYSDSLLIYFIVMISLRRKAVLGNAFTGAATSRITSLITGACASTVGSVLAFLAIIFIFILKILPIIFSNIMWA